MSNHIKRFVYNTLVDRENICNLTSEAEILLKGLLSFDKIVIYGRRDSGKTSIVKNVVIPDWVKQTPGSMAIYVELYGVKSRRDVAEKLTIYFNKAYQASFTIKATLKSTAETLKNLRPSLSIAADGSMDASLKSDVASKIPRVEDFFNSVLKLHKSGVKIALVIDEFQDIALAEGVEEVLREEMQNLPFEIPVIILGSKQHLLAKIFQKPRAPFFNWGKRVEIKALPVEEYNSYISERFALNEITADEATLTYLQDLLLRNPEAINMFCSHIVDQLSGKERDERRLTVSILDQMLREYVAALGGEFEAYLDHFTKSEQRVLTLVAKRGILYNSTGKDALAKTELSVSGMRKIIEKMLDHAEIYREEKGLALSKPLLMHYLRDWRF